MRALWVWLVIGCAVACLSDSERLRLDRKREFCLAKPADKACTSCYAGKCADDPRSFGIVIGIGKCRPRCEI